MPVNKSNTYFQMRNIQPAMRRAIKTAAAIEGLSMEKWLIKAAKAQLRRQGIVIEADDYLDSQETEDLKGETNGEDET